MIHVNFGGNILITPQQKGSYIYSQALKYSKVAASWNYIYRGTLSSIKKCQLHQIQLIIFTSFLCQKEVSSLPYAHSKFYSPVFDTA